MTRVLLVFVVAWAFGLAAAYVLQWFLYGRAASAAAIPVVAGAMLASFVVVSAL